MPKSLSDVNLASLKKLAALGAGQTRGFGFARSADDREFLFFLSPNEGHPANPVALQNRAKVSPPTSNSKLFFAGTITLVRNPAFKKPMLVVERKAGGLHAGLPLKTSLAKMAQFAGRRAITKKNLAFGPVITADRADDLRALYARAAKTKGQGDLEDLVAAISQCTHIPLLTELMRGVGRLGRGKKDARAAIQDQLALLRPPAERPAETATDASNMPDFEPVDFDAMEAMLGDADEPVDLDAVPTFEDLKEPEADPPESDDTADALAMIHDFGFDDVEYVPPAWEAPMEAAIADMQWTQAKLGDLMRNISRDQRPALKLAADLIRKDTSKVLTPLRASLFELQQAAPEQEDARRLAARDRADAALGWTRTRQALTIQLRGHAFGVRDFRIDKLQTSLAALHSALS